MTEEIENFPAEEDFLRLYGNRIASEKTVDGEVLENYFSLYIKSKSVVVQPIVIIELATQKGYLNLSLKLILATREFLMFKYKSGGMQDEDYKNVVQILRAQELELRRKIN